MAAVALNKEITSERVKFDTTKHQLDELTEETRANPENESMTDAEIAERVEIILLDKIQAGETAAKFQLGLLYFQQEKFEKALSLFDDSKDFDYQSLFMYGIMKYDGIGTEVNMKEGMDSMLIIAESASKFCRHLIYAARYNLGRAFYQGYGEMQSDSEAETWFLLAADDGNPKASVKAQSVLGMFYSRLGTEYHDLKKAFFWHSEACGNGSLESQGALGVMYLYGIGVKKDMDAAYICLKEASKRGNVYAMGNLVTLYYKSKLYTKACDLGYKTAQLNEEDVPVLATDTDCLPLYIAKGIAMACFIYARCLVGGHSLKPNKELAKIYYSKSYRFDPDICALLQHSTQQGTI
ncbi:LRP2-binding protein-like [Physella acuta]|uniref:LRP2-binding protein-like n=1 Tax=Physella acuta TaxID=109671 RepID=UPI0027DBAAC8|nr:LRP2-binding protein-like [Physella acuta]